MGTVLVILLGRGEIRDINIYLSLDDCGINAIGDLFTDVFKIKERSKKMSERNYVGKGKVVGKFGNIRIGLKPEQLQHL